MVKLVNKKDKKVVIEVADYLAGDYISTKEWELYKEPVKSADHSKEPHKADKK